MVMSLRAKKNDLRDEFLKHEEVVNIINQEDFSNLKNNNPLVYLGHLVFGCFSLVISLVIVLHTIFAIIPGTQGWGHASNTFLDGAMSNISKYGGF